MTRDRSKIFRFAACFGGMLVSMSICAADLSIPGVSLADGSGATTTQKKNAAYRAKAKGHSVTGMKKQQRPDQVRRPRIVTYNLFGDPVFKLTGAINDKRQLPPLSGAASPGSGYLPSAAIAMPPGRLLGTDEADDAGIAFDCRDNPGSTHAIPRRVTACYKAQLDKGWQTQTYLSKGFAASKSEWGGGVSVMYAH